jgi:phosphoserine phosphatase
MPHVLTLVAPPGTLRAAQLHAARDALRALGARTDAPDWLAEAEAADLPFEELSAEPALAAARGALAGAAIDLFAQPLAGRRKRLLLADMDSTIVTTETLDEIAAFAGLKAEIAEITRRSMNGELDFREALMARVGRLRGLGVAALEQTWAATELTPGACELIATMRAAGAHCALVSGGFTFFTSRLVERLALDDARANVLGVENGVLTGCVVGQIVDGEAKRQALLDTCQRLGARPEQAIAIGDGANDLPMMRAAGISIAYHAKPVVRAQATYAVNHHGLDAVPPLFFK